MSPADALLNDGPSERAALDHPVWREIAPWFVPAEFRHPEAMDAAFLRRLARARQRARVPFRMVSDHRPPEHNARVGGARHSAHLEIPCRAADLHVANNEERFRVVAALLAEGFERIGIYPARPDGSGSVHVDASETHPAPRLWTRY